MADTQITATQVIADFGSYYQDAGQTENSLLMLPYEQFGSLSAFTLYPTEDTILRLSAVDVQDVLQPYQDAYTPKGGVTFNPVELTLKQVKIDQQFNPNALVNSWLGFLTSSKTDRKTWPFVRWFIEKYLMPKVQEDLEKSAIFKGVYATPTAGTAGASTTVIDGMRKKINDAITATDITTIATGAPSATATTWCEQVEAFVAGIDELFWGIPMELNMSRTLAKRYREGRRQKYNMSYAQVGDLDMVEDTEIKIVGRASQRGSDKIWMSPKENLAFGVKGFSNASGFELESVDRNVKIWSDFWIGVGYLRPELVFTNDRDLV